MRDTFEFLASDESYAYFLFSFCSNRYKKKDVVQYIEKWSPPNHFFMKEKEEVIKKVKDLYANHYEGSKHTIPDNTGKFLLKANLTHNSYTNRQATLCNVQDILNIFYNRRTYVYVEPEFLLEALFNVTEVL